MIKRTKQNWSIGEMVNVGFLKLRVESYGAGYFDQDAYYLTNPKNGNKYQFTPHNGLYGLPDNYEIPKVKTVENDFQI